MGHPPEADQSVARRDRSRGRGPGALSHSGRTNSDDPPMFAVLIALAFPGILLYYVVVAPERVFAGWAGRGQG
jgi:NitT/TauT family transport system permease protein